MQPDSPQLHLGRQPILDRDGRVYAYELLFRSAEHNEANVSDHALATAAVITRAFSELGLAGVVEPYKAFINFDMSMLMSGMLELIPPERFVLEVLEHVDITPDLLARCQELKERGFVLAIDDYAGAEDRYAPLLELCEYVKVDLTGAAGAGLAQIAQRLRRYPVRLIAEKVEDAACHKLCLDAGFDLFQGYYFARPEVVSGKPLGHSELAMLRLMGLVLQDADTAQLEAILKREPGLSMKLLRLTNSAASGFHEPIRSLRQAIVVLGRKQLQRWLQLLMFVDSVSGRADAPLLQLAAMRGRFMECLMLRAGNTTAAAENAFLVGVMSLMPAALGVDVHTLVAHIPVASDVRDALTGHKGLLGELLTLAEKVDDSMGDAYALLGQGLPGVTQAMVTYCVAEALSWACSVGEDMPGS